MTNKHKTHLVLISDRSGSMYAGKDEYENAINHLIDDQKQHLEQCEVTFVEFDDKYDMLYRGVDIQKVSKYTLVPRGMTALYDAVGKTLVSVGEYLAAQPEDSRAGLVLVVIATDGMNNNSHEYSGTQVADMIQHQTDVYKWKFVFLGVEINAEKVAKDLNIQQSSAISLCRSQSQHTYSVTSQKLSGARSGLACGIEADALNVCFSADEKNTAKQDSTV